MEAVKVIACNKGKELTVEIPIGMTGAELKLWYENNFIELKKRKFTGRVQEIYIDATTYYNNIAEEVFNNDCETEVYYDE
jgi:hypothetical protein